MSDPHKWQFAARFRRNAFGWRSDTPIQRIKEAIAEIRQVARKEPALAAEGAVLLLEKVAPALEHVDSSSGAIGSAVNRAIETLVPIVAKAPVDVKLRQRWLERLWKAIEEDGISYIERLADHWGSLCADRKLAQRWVDEFRPMVEHVWRPGANGHGYYNGTAACLSSMMAAGQYEALLSLLETAPHRWWHDRRWGVQALVALGRKAEALRYAEESRGVNDPVATIAETCEAILLSSGLADEAYRRYALQANQGTTHLATYRTIARKYPDRQPADILRDLVASTPGSEGKWFAAAKDAGLFDVAIALANASPTDPRTLTRAARDFADEQPAFALSAGLAALQWMSLGYGYEITGADVLDAYSATVHAATAAGADVAGIKAQIRDWVMSTSPGNPFMKSILAYRLTT